MKTKMLLQVLTVLHLLSLLIAPLASAEQRLLYVQPTTSNDTSMCSINEGAHCVTFVRIVENETLAKEVFKSNTTLVFLPGSHEVDLGERELFLTVENVENIVFEGRGDLEPGFQGRLVPTTKIECLSHLGIAFVNISGLSIVNLTINGCGANISPELAFSIETRGIHSVGPQQKAALVVINVLDFTTEFLTIEYSRGYGLLAVNILGDSTIDKSMFFSNNIYTQNEESCYFPEVIPDDITACNGGNAVILYKDLPECPDYDLTYSLSIRDSTFALGTNINGGSLSDLLLSRGTGLGLIMSQSSYGVETTIQGVTSYGNGALSGANLYIVFYETVQNSTVSIKDTLSSTANNYLLRADNYLQISAGLSAGLHFDYGLTVPVKPVCERHTEQYQTTVLDISNSTFHNNSATTGAGLYIQVNPKSNIDSSFFVHISITDTTISENQGFLGAGLFLSERVSIDRQQRTQVILNNVQFLSNGFITPIQNTSRIDGITFSVLEVVTFSNVTLSDCYFFGSQGTALNAYNSYLFLSGNSTFRSNNGVDGGALKLENSYLYFEQDTYVYFYENTARRLGGAIIVVAREDIVLPCFFQIIDSGESESNVNLYFEGNYAQAGGSVLYGGTIDDCLVISNSEENSTYVFESITKIGPHREDTSLISSNPTTICICENDGLKCTNAFVSIQLYPGEPFSVPIIAMGQRGGIAPTSVYSFSDIDETALQGRRERIQQIGKKCTNITFSSVTKSNVILVSTGDQPTLLIDVTALDCPLGFILANGVCVCDPVPQIQNYDLECNLDDRTVHRSGGSWINISYSGTQQAANGVIIHFNCPTEHCLSQDTDVDLTDPDSQCAFNRTGILCGACKPGLSLTMYSEQCKECTNSTIALVILYLIAGILLVAVLFALNLVISVGTLGGIIFYANMVKTNMSILYPSNAFNVLTVFISWLNLDFGIDACFYDGMDSYAKNWLSYAFPLYVWLIVSVILIASRYSLRISKWCGSTTVSVLATLFLLSYNKLLIDVYQSLAWTLVVFPNGDYDAVWSQDGNIRYLHGKHIPMFIFANLMLVFFLVPYTLLLVLVPLPCIQAHTNLRFLSWLNKLKPFLDAHYNPYKDRYRNWTGVLLLVRIVYTVIVSVNVYNDSALTLLVLSIITSLLLALAWIGGGVYKKWPMNVLEGTSYLNLSILSASVFYILKTHGRLEGAIYTSISIALLQFVLIISYHVYKRGSKVDRFKGMAQKMMKKMKRDEVEEKEDDFEGSIMKTIRSQSMTYTDLREPLLED